MLLQLQSVICPNAKLHYGVSCDRQICLAEMLNKSLDATVTLR
jgi:hypothetical protein